MKNIMSHIFGEHFSFFGSFFGSSFSSKTFIKNDDPEHKTQVNHIDHNRSNNDANNLEWITPKAPDIAKIVGTTEGNIRNIIKGRNWKWISKNYTFAPSGRAKPLEKRMFIEFVCILNRSL